MRPTVAEVVAEFEAAAKAAQQAEGALRKKMAEEIARLERQRAFAFRRTRLVRALASAAGMSDEDAAVSAQRAAVREELGWTSASAAHDAILEQLEPVGRVVWQCACGLEEGTPEAINAKLAEFEAWFETTHGKSFYVLFDQYMPEVPVVDF